MDMFLSLPYIGELFIHEIYMYYDEPLIFTCKNKAMSIYFFLLVDSSNLERSWIMTPISEAKLQEVLADRCELRAIFTSPEVDEVIHIVDDSEGVRFGALRKDELSDDMLPLPETYLNCPSREGEQIKLLTSDSQKERRDIMDLILEKEGTGYREIACDVLGRILESVQDLVYALHDPQQRLLGPLSSSTKTDARLSFAESFPGSFGMRLKSNSISDLCSETKLTPTLLRLNELLDVTSDASALSLFLKTNSPRAIAKYRNFLKALITNNYSLKIRNASPNNSYYEKDLAKGDLVEYLKTLENEANETIIDEEHDGRLSAINVETHTFRFRTEDESLITGKLHEELFTCSFKLPSRARTRIQSKIMIDPLSNLEKIEHTLLSYETYEVEAEV